MEIDWEHPGGILSPGCPGGILSPGCPHNPCLSVSGGGIKKAATISTIETAIFTIIK